MSRTTARKVKGEGWDVVYTPSSDFGPKQIQRCDNPTDRTWHSWPIPLDPAFDFDADAVKHVIARAKRGDKVCIDALWECDQDQLIHEILWGIV